MRYARKTSTGNVSGAGACSEEAKDMVVAVKYLDMSLGSKETRYQIPVLGVHLDVFLLPSLPTTPGRMLPR